MNIVDLSYLVDEITNKVKADPLQWRTPSFFFGSPVKPHHRKSLIYPSMSHVSFPGQDLLEAQHEMRYGISATCARLMREYIG